MTEETQQPAGGDDARVVTPAHTPPEGASTTATWRPDDGAALDYTATAGWTVLRAEEAPTAEVFSVSYVADADEARPVTFVFNGGPGAASAYLHVGVAGPLRVDFPTDGRLPSAPARVVDNADSWLAFTDLVFIDPVGTGFSRLLPPKEGDKDADTERYYRPSSDLAAMGQFISRWLTTNRRWDAPVLLAGESYGGYRVGRLARRLQQDVGVGLVGVILISPALELDMLAGTDYDVLAWVDRLPTMAAAAHHHGRSRVDGDLAAITSAAVAFATGPYASLLLRGASADPDEREATLGTVGDLLGLDGNIVRRHRGRVRIDTFARELLRDERRVLGLYDATVTAIDPFPDRDPYPGPDPTLAGTAHVFTTAVNHVLRDWLGVTTEREYTLLSMDVNKAWKPDDDTHALELSSGASDDLRYGLALNPHLRALLVHGQHDLVTPWATTQRVRDLLDLDPATAGRVTTAVYDGGHMFYTREASRRAFTADVAALVVAATSADE
jgi:carboxypeptidase C (cathepsin A)